MQALRLRRVTAGLLAAAVAGVGIQAVTISPASAECRPGDPDCTVETGPNGGSVRVQFSGTGVSAVDGSSMSVPPDCWFQDGMELQPARDQRLALEVAGWLFPFLKLLSFRLAPLSAYQQALEDLDGHGPRRHQHARSDHAVLDLQRPRRRSRSDGRRGGLRAEGTGRRD